MTDSWPHEVEATYRQHLDALLGHARQVCPDQSSAEDACHDVFLRIVTTPRSADSLGLPYLVVAVRNACRDHLRREKKWRPLDPGGPEPESTESDQDEDARSLLITGWQSLVSQRQLMVITLWADGLSYQEISEALEVTATTVRTHLNRAKANLRMLVRGRERGERREERGERREERGEQQGVESGISTVIGNWRWPVGGRDQPSSSYGSLADDPWLRGSSLLTRDDSLAMTEPLSFRTRR